jgi:hypothetical protein
MLYISMKYAVISSAFDIQYVTPNLSTIRLEEYVVSCHQEDARIQLESWPSM